MYVPITMYVPMTMFVYNNSCLIIHVLVCTDDDLCVYRSRSIPPRSPPLPQKYAQNGAEAEVCRGRETAYISAAAEETLTTVPDTNRC
jgi:hypothetical protein